MAEARVALESRCTLDAQAFRVRESEFRDLFSRAFLDAERRHAGMALFGLDPACEPELRDLLGREQSCCSFFEFGVAAAGGRLELTVRVPAGCEAALAGLLALARA